MTKEKCFSLTNISSCSDPMVLFVCSNAVNMHSTANIVRLFTWPGLWSRLHAGYRQLLGVVQEGDRQTEEKDQNAI